LLEVEKPELGTLGCILQCLSKTLCCNPKTYEVPVYEDSLRKAKESQSDTPGRKQQEKKPMLKKSKTQTKDFKGLGGTEIPEAPPVVF
jgi:hypothetical protein